MEIKKFLFNFALISSIMSCSNAPEMETGEIRLLINNKESSFFNLDTLA